MRREDIDKWVVRPRRLRPSP